MIQLCSCDDATRTGPEWTAPGQRPPRPTVSKKRAPTRAIEKEMWDLGHEVVVGVDEVGRGAWAGPLMVGAAILPRDTRVNGVRDSKLLSERERERCSTASPDGACRGRSARRARRSATSSGCRRRRSSPLAGPSKALSVVPDVAVTDGKWDFVSPSVANVELAVKADLRCLSVAAASILAKVVRDREMRRHADRLSELVVRHEQGLPVPRAQVGTHRLRTIDDSPAYVGVHGSLRPVDGDQAHPTGGSTRALLTRLLGFVGEHVGQHGEPLGHRIGVVEPV